MFVEDNKGTSDKMYGFYYCATHKCRTTSANQECWTATARTYFKT